MRVGSPDGHSSNVSHRSKPNHDFGSLLLDHHTQPVQTAHGPLRSSCPLTFQRSSNQHSTFVASSCSDPVVIYGSQLPFGRPVGPRAAYSGPSRRPSVLCGGQVYLLSSSITRRRVSLHLGAGSFLSAHSRSTMTPQAPVDPQYRTRRWLLQRSEGESGISCVFLRPAGPGGHEADRPRMHLCKQPRPGTQIGSSRFLLTFQSCDAGASTRPTRLLSSIQSGTLPDPAMTCAGVPRSRACAE
jgi:hypothetical protein